MEPFDVNAFLKQAKELGLSGEEVSKTLRDERAAARENQRKELELKEKELERVEAEKQRNHEILLQEYLAKQKEQEVLLAQLGAKDSSTKEPSSSSRTEKPRIPAFDDSQDDMDSYLLRFERLASAYGWEKKDFALYLGTLLKGKALKVYTNLSKEVADDFDSLKEALLKAYSINADTYRKKFRTAKVKEDENYTQLVVRLEQYFDRWLTISNVDKDFESLSDFMIKDQILSNCPHDMRVFLKERDFENSCKLAEAADRFRNAHDMVKRGKKSSFTPSSKGKSESQKADTSHLVCHGCGETGHIRPKCPKNPRNFKSVNAQPSKVQFVFESDRKPDNSRVDPNGKVFDRPAEIVLDNGCNTILVHEKLIPDNFKKGITQDVYDFLGIKHVFPAVRCHIKSKFFSGWVNAIAAPLKFADVLLGSVPGVTEPEQDIGNLESSEKVMNVQTRMGKERESMSCEPLSCPDISELDVGMNDFIKDQNDCQSLENVREKARKGMEVRVKNRIVKFVKIDGLIYRVCIQSKSKTEIGSKQLVVPEKHRARILHLAHDSIFSGHFSHRKTEDKVFRNFYWPGAGADIVRYCRSCVICQRVSPKGKVAKVPMKQMPIISEPFSRIGIDLIGPIIPVSNRGHKYVLTLIDYATRFPEAVPLKNIDTLTIAESLVEIFSRVGVPKEIVSDNGQQFKSNLMSEIHRLLNIKAIYTSPYHACTNGAVERLNGVLKAMIKKLCADHPKDWDRFIPAVLFSYREIPNDSLKFSPFELLYGRNVRGPLNILQELWTNNSLDSEQKTTYQYVLDLRSRLEETARLAASNALTSSTKYKDYYDRKTKPRKFNVGEKVLLLLPAKSNKLEMQWQGPYVVEECRGNGVDYVIKVRGRLKLFHINMLKKFYEREPEKKSVKVVQSVIVDDTKPVGNTDIVFLESRIDQLQNINICQELEDTKKNDLSSLFQKYPDVFSSVPGKTSSIEHVIRLTTDVPVHRKPYPMHQTLTKDFNDEVDKMIELGIIEPSTSPYCSPVVMVRKEDKTWRLCIDFRALNDVTLFDAEPMPTREEALGNFVGDTFFSEIDLVKGYWQIPMEKDSKEYTAFATHRGLMQFVRLPFGLKTACATFIRLMRKVILGLKNTECYFDNIVVHSKTWEEHVLNLDSLFTRLREHGLTAGPGKCYFGYPRIRYLGLLLGSNELSILDDKVKAILDMPLPSNKKELRSFLGSTNFYSKFIPDYSTLAAPLTNMLKKNCANKLDWSKEKVESFQNLKRYLSSDPVLQLPDYSKVFYLRTDASNCGIGSVLLQETEGKLMPIAYASRKLLPREVRYPTIERECLSIVWSLDKFKFYLFGREFILQTDQEPLSYLRSMRNSNARLYRWALALQPYSFRIEYIRGCENNCADLLSRCPVDLL